MQCGKRVPSHPRRKKRWYVLSDIQPLDHLVFEFLQLTLVSYCTVGVSLWRRQHALSSAFPCSVKRAAAGQRLLTSSAGIMEIPPGCDVIAGLCFYNAHWRHQSAHPLFPLSFSPGLKPACFTNPTPRSFSSSSRTAFTDYGPDRLFWATRFLFLVCLIFSFLCRALD